MKLNIPENNKQTLGNENNQKSTFQSLKDFLSENLHYGNQTENLQKTSSTGTFQRAMSKSVIFLICTVMT